MTSNRFKLLLLFLRRSLRLLRADFFQAARVGPQRLRDANGAVLLLVALQNRDEHARHRAGRPIEGVHKDVLLFLRLLPALGGLGRRLVPNVQAPRLVIRAVRSAGDLAVPPQARHPGLHVELAVRRGLEISPYRPRPGIQASTSNLRYAGAPRSADAISRTLKCRPSSEKSSTSMSRSSWWSSSLCSGVPTTNISTLLNWCTRYSPLPAAPAAPASVRKQWPKAANRMGSWSSGRIWSMK